MLPVNEKFVFIGKDTKEYSAEIEIFTTLNLEMYPEGVSATFRLFVIDSNGERTLVYLIDNHAPFGFHEHYELPENHESRGTIHAKNWQEAWNLFQQKYKDK